MHHNKDAPIRRLVISDKLRFCIGAHAIMTSRSSDQPQMPFHMISYLGIFDECTLWNLRSLELTRILRLIADVRLASQMLELGESSIEQPSVAGRLVAWQAHC